MQSQCVNKRITLRVSEAIRNEWMVRGIGEVIAALDGVEVGAEITVAPPVVREVLADCEFMADPKAVDSSVGERRAYSALAEQCRKALAGCQHGETQ
jgi:hypothetical protein